MNEGQSLTRKEYLEKNLLRNPNGANPTCTPSATSAKKKGYGILGKFSKFWRKISRVSAGVLFSIIISIAFPLPWCANNLYVQENALTRNMGKKPLTILTLYPFSSKYSINHLHPVRNFLFAIIKGKSEYAQSETFIGLTKNLSFLSRTSTLKNLLSEGRESSRKYNTAETTSKSFRNLLINDLRVERGSSSNVLALIPSISKNKLII